MLPQCMKNIGQYCHSLSCQGSVKNGHEVSVTQIGRAEVDLRTMFKSSNIQRSDRTLIRHSLRLCLYADKLMTSPELNIDKQDANLRCLSQSSAFSGNTAEGVLQVGEQIVAIFQADM